MDTTITCYLRSILPTHSLPSIGNMIDDYVMIASRLYTRGTYLANFVAMYLIGQRMPPSCDPDLLPIDESGFGFFGRETVRYDREVNLLVMRPFIEFAMPHDVRNSAFKQVFLPERWPTKNQPLYETLEDVLSREEHLPPEPEGWKKLMNPTGWDNSINRMATKLYGNFQVHCRSNLAKRTAGWLAQFDFDGLYDDAAKVCMQQMLLQRPRPLTIADHDYEMIMDLRFVLGVEENDSTWYLPNMPPFNEEVVALHAFLTCYGSEERNYFPVARRSRKYTYLDVKIYDDLTSGIPENKKRGRQHETGSRSLGDAMGLTPASFKENRKRARKEIRGEIARRRKKRPNNPSIKRLQKKRKRLGRGFMHPKAVVNSVETDGVGARLCVRTPIDMRPFIKEITFEEEGGTEEADDKHDRPRQESKRKRKRKNAETEDREDAKEKERLYGECLRSEPPITVGFDNGRKKLFVGAISREGYKKPETYVFTRSRYYSEMRYWRHEAWSREQTSRKEVAEALADVSRGGGYRNCDLGTWRESLKAEERHRKILDDEFIVKPCYAVWKMRLHRLKRASLDRATGEVIREATVDQSPRRLLLGIGNTSFTSTGKGELSAPTKAVTEAMKRNLRRMTIRTGREARIEEIEEFRSTKCCCACGSITESAPIRGGNGEERRLSRQRERSSLAEPAVGRRKRLRLCTKCEPTGGKRRDRDVQGARNMLWILQHEYYGGRENRPWYLTRKGCCVEQNMGGKRETSQAKTLRCEEHHRESASEMKDGAP